MPTYSVRHNTKSETCPWEVWRGTTLLAAYETCDKAVDVARLKHDQEDNRPMVPYLITGRRRVR